MPGDSGRVSVEEKVVLEKFDGDPADGKLIERLTVLNGKIIKREAPGEV